jgi:hypothetical protein
MARDQTAVSGGEVVHPAQIVVGSSTARPVRTEGYPSIGRFEEDSLRVSPQR